ncbi:MAG: SLC13 family permease [Leptonema sp. (in: bacteria)]
MPLSLVILLIVFLLMIIRRIGTFYFSIWQIMSLGALLSLATFQISLKEAWNSINFEVIFFLIGMFIIGDALNKSGYLDEISYKIFSRTNNANQLILAFIFTMGFLSSILMNDTIAIIGTGIALSLSKKFRISSKLLLLSLCYSITIGSTMSPIGNPQNLIIATHSNFSKPFESYLKFLFLPTILNLFLLFLILKLFFKEEFQKIKWIHQKPPSKKSHLVFLSKSSLFIVTFLILFKIIIIIFRLPFDFDLVYIALLGSLPILLGSKERWKIIKGIDWTTIIFFISMFVLMQSVWNTNSIQKFLKNYELHNLLNLVVISILLSQVISNVPLVYLFLSFLDKPSVVELISLAWSSTIAGNLTILGAVSNVIIIQNAEKKAECFTFLDFFKIGLPLTLINSLVYLIYISIVQS